ncbi:hypothetical protein ACFYW6_36660 [Streptomyces sp. NPDC002659]|uniref:hypothetical protein n=1 Tax=Streptomyces sp. NPDC002659 TaxID=3364656 RepID=UPI0036AC54E9
MSGIWKQVLSALTQGGGPGSVERERLLALGAAELAHARSGPYRPAQAADVQRIAFEEFSLPLGHDQALAALTERRCLRKAPPLGRSGR